MPTTLETISEEAMVLPAEQRLLLARRLLDSVDFEPEPGADAAWEAEIRHRVECLDAGKAKPIAASEVFKRLERIAPEK